MANIQVFEYQNSKVRTVDMDGEAWFVLKDVCAVLGISNNRMAADRLDDDEKGVSLIDTLGGKQEMVIVNESGLYHVILAHEELEEKDKRIAELTPDAEFARAVCIADNCRTATSIAKDYGLTAEKLNKLLYSQRVQYKDSDGQWVLYKPYQGKGYTKNRKGKAIQRSNSKTYIPNTTVWTVEGEKLIHEQLKKLGITPRIETRAVAEQQDFGGWED